MKNQVLLVIFLLFGLAFLIYLFTFDAAHAAKLESGVTVNAPPTTETEKICNDQMDNDNDGKIDAADEDCAAAPAGPTPGTCGLQIVSGVPINYGQLTRQFWGSEQKVVMIKNEGTSQAGILIKAGNWIGDSAPNPNMSGPELTHVGLTLDVNYDNKRPLTNDGLVLGQISGGQIIPVYFRFIVPENAPIGSFHQEVSIELLC